jgi:hypothetical protein
LLKASSWPLKKLPDAMFGPHQAQRLDPVFEAIRL